MVEGNKKEEAKPDGPDDSFVNFRRQLLFDAIERYVDLCVQKSLESRLQEIEDRSDKYVSYLVEAERKLSKLLDEHGLILRGDMTVDKPDKLLEGEE